MLLSLVPPGILKKIYFSDHEFSILEKIATEKIDRQRFLKEYFAVSILD